MGPIGPILGCLHSERTFTLDVKMFDTVEIYPYM